MTMFRLCPLRWGQSKANPVVYNEVIKGNRNITLSLLSSPPLYYQSQEIFHFFFSDGRALRVVIMHHAKT